MRRPSLLRRAASRNGSVTATRTLALPKLSGGRRGGGMIKFRERNLARIGAVTGAVLLVAVLVALNFQRIPFLSGTRTYRALFANAGGLTTGNIVTVAGVRVGSITGLSLHGARVQVTFTVADGVLLGSRTSAAMKVLTPIGQEYLELDPAGKGRLSGPIPESRTTIPETLVSDLSTLTRETGKIDLQQLERSLGTTGATLQGISPGTVRSALIGLDRFGAIIAGRQQDLSALVTSASKLTGVLADHTGELVNLVGQGDLVLKVLEQRRAEITTLLRTTSSLGKDLTSVLNGKRGQLVTLVDNLDSVSRTLAKDRSDLSSALPLIAAFSRYSANATGSGPFADFTLPTLLVPDNVSVQCSKMRLTDKLAGCRI